MVAGSRMDALIKKIEELRVEAQNLKLQQEGSQSPVRTPFGRRAKRDFNDHLSSPAAPAAPPLAAAASPSTSGVRKVDFEGEGDGDWVAAFRAEAGPWKGDKLVVLSLFDGIGGIWEALTRLGIPFIGYSSEVSASAIQVLKARHPEVKHVGDVRKLEKPAIPEKVDLVVGGFPCQDLSIMGKKEGLHGRRSKLFFDLLRVIKVFKPKWFLVENVMSMSWVDREEISRHLKVPPMELDSQEITASKRRRLYWTNIPYPLRLPRLRDHPSTSLQSCLHNAVALEQKAGVILCSNKYKGGTARIELVLESNSKSLRYINHTEIEMLMGYPRNYTLVLLRSGPDEESSPPVQESSKKAKGIAEEPSPATTRLLRQNRTSRNFYQPQGWGQKTRQEALKDNERWLLLGNSFSVPVIAYLISPLLKSGLRSQARPVTITGSVKEEELSAMEPGDLWALFNEHGRPNWYAVIQSRTGDRFSKIPDAGKKRNVTKTPLEIHMRYLEMTPAYLELEADQWNPNRGTGMLVLRQATDVQDSWLAFSHRVTSFIKFDDTYFVYPGKDEVWAVYDVETWTRYFVYVLGSTINVQNLATAKPGQEGFYASCLLLQKTTEHETYRKTELKVELTDLKAFCFRVPFHFKQEADLLKAEVAGVKSRKVLAIDRESGGVRRRRRKSKGKRKSGQDTSEDEEDEDDEDDVAEEDDDDEAAAEEDDEEALRDDAAMQVDMPRTLMPTLPGLVILDDDSEEGGNEAGSRQGSGSSTVEVQA